MKRLPRSLAVLGLGLAASSCSQLLTLELTGSLERPEVVIVNQVSGRLGRACVKEIEVWNDQARTGRAHWSVRAAGERCVRIERIVYGETPTGFIEVVAPAPLAADIRFSILAGGWSGGFANVPWRGGAKMQYGADGWRPTAGS